jgi:hypothetical protein
VVLGTFMFFVMFASALGTVFGERVDGHVAHDDTVVYASHYIEATTKPDERIFVWGFSPWVYGYSHRKPAGRYVFETYVTGFVPWFWEKAEVERARIVPGSVEALLSDLDREKPVVVVDAGSIMMGRSMRSYDKPNAWLHEHYCFEFREGALDIFRKKPEDGSPCPVPWYPRPHVVVDYLGRAMPVGMLVTLDQDTSRRLPTGSYFHPIYFLDAPPPARLDAAIDQKRAREEKEGAEQGFFVQGLEP